ncbi:hypothetical protein BAE44_0001004, partial [Dichanthelium oligosanthes]
LPAAHRPVVWPVAAGGHHDRASTAAATTSATPTIGKPAADRTPATLSPPRTASNTSYCRCHVRRPLPPPPTPASYAHAASSWTQVRPRIPS